MAIASFAVHAVGAQAVLLNPAYTARELGIVVSHAQPLVLLHHPSWGDAARSVAQYCDMQAVDEAFMEALPSAVLEFPLPAADSLATLQYTGGTTGRPKGVNLTHRAITTNVAQREALLPSSSADERILCVTPLFHSYASAMGLHLSAYCAGTLIIVPKYSAEETLRLLQEERITIFLGSPTLFVGLMSHPNFAATRFSSLRVCYSDSAALPANILVQWERMTGCKIYEGYGQTEAGPV